MTLADGTHVEVTRGAFEGETGTVVGTDDKHGENRVSIDGTDDVGIIPDDGLWVPDEELRFTAREFGTLLDWYMVSDPWPLDSSDDLTVKQMLNEEAAARGYDDWVHAYHDNHMEEV